MAVVCTARQTPAPIEYLLRKAGLGQEESMPSSGRLDFMSQLTTQAQRPGPRDAWIATGARWPGSLERMVRPLCVMSHVLLADKTPCRHAAELSRRTRKKRSRKTPLHLCGLRVLCVRKKKNASRQVRQVRKGTPGLNQQLVRVCMTREAA